MSQFEEWMLGTLAFPVRRGLEDDRLRDFLLALPIKADAERYVSEASLLTAMKRRLCGERARDSCYVAAAREAVAQGYAKFQDGELRRTERAESELAKLDIITSSCGASMVRKPGNRTGMYCYRCGGLM